MPQLSRRTFLQSGACAAMATAIPSQALANGHRRKNVLFIATDDQNASLGCYGHPLAHTPNLDRLAGKGVRFDAAYCQYPWCSPSRSSLMTGLAPDTTRVYDLKTHFRQALPNVVTIGQLFRESGYFSARVGKIYHYANPEQIGTDGLDDPETWDWTYDPNGVDHTEEEKFLTDFTPTRGLGSAIAFYRSKATDHEMTDGIGADHVIQLLRQYRTEPFFIAYGLYRPHVPWIVPEAYFERHPLDRIRAVPRHPGETQIAPPPAYWTYPPNFGMDDLQQRQAIQAYHASTTFMDAQVGRVLNALETLGLAENTLVVFWSDHGWLLGEHEQWMKQTLFEGATRVPVIFAGAGVPIRGGTCHRTIELLDLYPTIAEICGLAGEPHNLQGESLSRLLRDPGGLWSKPAVSQVQRYATHQNPSLMGYSIRNERYRYTSWQDGKAGEELYDYRTDPMEQRNLAADPSISQVKFLLKTNLHDISEVRGRASVMSH